MHYVVIIKRSMNSGTLIIIISIIITIIDRGIALKKDPLTPGSEA